MSVSEYDLGYIYILKYGKSTQSIIVKDLMQVSISSITIPPWDKPPGHDLKGAKTLPPGQSLCTKPSPRDRKGVENPTPGT